MSTQTTYYGLNKPGSSDLVNPLVDTFPNWDTIDTGMHDNYLLGVTTATEIVTTGVHALTRANTDLPFFRYVATANFNAGDTFTLDGTSVSAYTTDGSSLGDDDIVAGAVVLACYNSTNTTITLFVSAKQSTIALAEDSEKLESHPASYFATAGDLNNTNANKFDSTGIAPAYNSNTTYSVGDVVTYQGKRYECNTNMAQAESWDPTHWNLIPVQTKLNNLQSNVGDLTQLTTTDKSSLVAATNEVKSALTDLDNTKLGGGDFTLQGTITTVNGSVSIPADCKEVVVKGSTRYGTWDNASGYTPRLESPIGGVNMFLVNSSDNVTLQGLSRIEINFGSINKVILKDASDSYNIHYDVFTR